MSTRLYRMSYLALAFGTNERLHAEIDKVYLKNRTYYYELSKNSDLAKWSCFQSLSAKQEEYVRKCIGILEDSYSDDGENELVLQWIKKGYNVVWNYARTNKVLSLTELFRKYLGKRETYRSLELQNLSSILVYLQDRGELGTEWDHTDSQNHHMTESFQNFLKPGTRDIHIKHYNKNLKSTNIDNLKEKIHLEKHYDYLYTALDHIMNTEADELGMSNTLDDIASFNVRRRRLFSRGASKYKVLWEKFFMVNGIHKFLGETVTVSKEEINFILAFCDEQIKELNMNEEMQTYFIITCLYFTILIKEYNTTKGLFLDKSQEDIHLSLVKQTEEIKKREKQLENKELSFQREKQKWKEKNAALSDEVKRLEVENKRLYQKLQEAEDNKKELQSLREMLFKLDKVDDPIDNPLSLEEKGAMLSAYKIAFIGGHVNLHKKLKEYVSSIRCFEIDKTGKDLSFVDKFDVIIIDVNYLSHSFYYRLMSQLNKNEANLCYLTRKQNIERVIDEIYEFVDELETKKAAN